MSWPKQLSDYLTSREFTITQHREYLYQQDNPPNMIIENALWFARTVFEPAREIVGPLSLSSGYRCDDLNIAIGGAKNSYHTNGLACDCYPLKMGLREAFLAICNSTVPFDQLIYEFGRWIHLGGQYEDGPKPRGQVFMIFDPGKYLLFDEDDLRVI